MAMPLLVGFSAREPARAAVEPYRVTELPFTALDLNNKGQVVGVTRDWIGAFWDAGNTQLITYPTPGYSLVTTYSLSDDGHVVISGSGGEGTAPHGVWRNGTLTFPEHSVSYRGRVSRCEPRDVNEKGELTGYGPGYRNDGSISGTIPVRWTNGVPAVLPFPHTGDAPSAYAYQVNDRGQVFGEWSDESGPPHQAYAVWTNGTRKDLPQGFGIDFWGTDLDIFTDSGQVGGRFWDGEESDAAIWDGAKVIRLGMPGNVLALNDNGQAVIRDDAGEYHLWDAGKTVPLKDLLPASYASYSIQGVEGLNDVGQILVRSHNPPSLLLSPGLKIDLAVFDANIDHTNGGEFPLPTNADPKVVLPRYTTQEWTNLARQVKAAAADGVTLLLLRARLSSAVAGTVKLKLAKGDVDAPLGSLWRVTDRALVDTTAAGGARDGGAEGPTEIELPVDTGSGPGERWAFALYRAPRDFDAANAALTEARGSRTVKLTVSTGTSGDEVAETLTVLRPLVILQHGTFDYPTGWDDFTLWKNSHQLRDTRRYPEIALAATLPFHVARTSFWEIKKAAGPVNANVPYLMPQINARLQEWREALNAAGTQADVITHSFGGVNMRFVAQEQPDGPLSREARNFRRINNWGHGSFHKLITIAATHRGSAPTNHLAWLNAKGLRPGLARFISDQTAHAIDQGAVLDQTVLSDTLLKLKQTRIPGHAIVGSGRLGFGADPKEAAPFIAAHLLASPTSPYGRAAGVKFIIRRGANGSVLLPNFESLRGMTNYFFNLDHRNNGYSLEDPNYDLTVGAVSQQGGMPEGAYSTHRDLGLNLAGKISHMHEENNPIVSARVEFLLRQPVKSRYFAWFPEVKTQKPTPWERELMDRTKFNPLWVNVTGAPTPAAASAPPTLTLSAPNGEVCPGDEVQVTVDWPRHELDLGMIQIAGSGGFDDVLLLNKQIRTATFTVPNRHPGPLPLVATLRDSRGALESVSVTLEVCDPEPYDEIRTEPETVAFTSVAPVPLKIYGRSNGGEWRDITRSKNTVVTSKTPETVRVTDLKALVPWGFGAGKVEVKVLRGDTLELTTALQGSPVELAGVFKKKQKFVKITSKQPAQLAILSSTGFDARTLSAQNIRLNGMPVLSAAAKDVNRDRVLDQVVQFRPADLPGLVRGTSDFRVLALSQGGTFYGGSVQIKTK